MKNSFIIAAGLVIAIVVGILVFRNLSSSKPLAETSVASQTVIPSSPSPVLTPKVIVDSSTNLKEVTDTLEPQDFSEDYQNLRNSF